MAEGWLIDPETQATTRFHRDTNSWLRDPKVFVDHGRPMPQGEPPLLKRRQHLRLEEARDLWKALRTAGWKPSPPLWGAETEP